MKKFFSILALFFLVQNGLLAQCNWTTADFPFNTTSSDASWSAGLYSSAQLGGAQTFAQISMRIQNVSSGSFSYNNVIIYMRESSATTYANGNYPGTAGFTQVYSGALQFNGVGSYSFNLSTPFVYSGTNSLEVFFIRNTQPNSPNNQPLFVRTEPDNSRPYVGKHGDGTFSGSRRQYNLVINGTNCDLSPLPVRLKTFATVKEGPATELQWITTSEENASHFNVEHSTTGKAWSSLGVVQSKGSQLVETRYTFQVAVSGSDYFRLKMVDKDETFSYSRILHVKGESAVRSAVYPNPVADRIQFSESELLNIRQITVHDLKGKVLYQTDKIDAAGIDADQFSSGLLVVKILKTSGKTETYKIMKI